MTSSDSIEVCISCGRGTGSGTALFSDRRTTRDDDGVAIHLCGDCNERAVAHFGRQPTDKDMVQIAGRSSGFGLGAR